jgi:hypothetical protein
MRERLLVHQPFSTRVPSPLSPPPAEVLKTAHNIIITHAAAAAVGRAHAHGVRPQTIPDHESMRGSIEVLGDVDLDKWCQCQSLGLSEAIPRKSTCSSHAIKEEGFVYVGNKGEVDKKEDREDKTMFQPTVVIPEKEFIKSLRLCNSLGDLKVLIAANRQHIGTDWPKL